MSIDKGLDKEDMVRIHNGMLLNHKKNEIMPFAATWMDLDIIILSKVNQRERKRSYDITVMWNLNYDIHELIYKAETDFVAFQWLSYI